MPSANASCGTCATPVYDDPSDSRQPCPQCQSLTRAKQLAGSNCTSTATSSSGQITITTYPQTLLDTARDLLEREQYGISIVVAHMACEVAAERTMTEAFGTKSIAHLEEPILAFINGFNLATPRIRELYSALTGDQIQQQPFWQGYKDSSKLRNGIMHSGTIAVRLEAEASVAAATALIDHLKK
jgi:hypothetical protein